MAQADAGPIPRPVQLDGAVWRARWALILVMACAALAGPVGYVGQNAYAALVGVAGLASLPALGVRRPGVAALGILMALALWAVASMAWSVDMPLHPDFHRYKAIEGLTAIKLVLETALYGAFVFLARDTPNTWASRILMVLTAGLALITLLMVVDAFTHWAVYRGLRLSAHAANKPEVLQRNAGRGCFAVALLFWPAAVWLSRTGRLVGAIALGAGLVVASVGLHVDSPLVALAMGGVVLVAVQRLGAPAVWALLAATLAYFALTPAFFVFVGPHLPHFQNDQGLAKASWGIRLDAWRFVAGKIVERPWQGWGIDASRVWPEVPMHPHNAALQFWLELGFVGAAIAALFWGYVWARIGAVAEADRANAGVFAAVAVAYLSIGAMSFGVWQEWWLALGALATVVCGLMAKAFPDGEPWQGLTELTPIGSPPGDPAPTGSAPPQPSSDPPPVGLVPLA